MESSRSSWFPLDVNSEVLKRRGTRWQIAARRCVPCAVALCSLRGQVAPVLLRRSRRATPRRRETVSCIEMRRTTAFCQVVPQQRFHKLGNKEWGKKKIRITCCLCGRKWSISFIWNLSCTNAKSNFTKRSVILLLCRMHLFSKMRLKLILINELFL